MLFYPFEEQRDLPATFVNLRDCQSWKLEVLGEELEAFVIFLVIETDAAQILRIIVGRFYASETNRLIETQSGCFIDGSRINALKKRVGFRADDKESSRLRQAIEPLKIEEPTINAATHSRRSHHRWHAPPSPSPDLRC